MIPFETFHFGQMYNTCTPVWNHAQRLTLLTYMYLTICYHYSLVAPAVHDDVIKWKHFPRYWPFVRGIHRSRVNSPHKGQWRGALMFSLICAWINSWVNNHEAGDLRRYRAHYDVTVMKTPCTIDLQCWTPFEQHLRPFNRFKCRSVYGPLFPQTS